MGLGATAHLLVGALSHSSRWRAVLAESEDYPHLVEALDGVLRRLGGCTEGWRFDRMSTVCHPATGRLTATFAPVAKHYGVEVASARRGAATARAWWRRPTTPRRNAGGAPWPTTSRRPRPRPGWTSSASGSATPGRTRRARTTVGALAEAEPLAAPPLVPFPAEVSVARIVSAQALVAFRGNFYSVRPGWPAPGHGPAPAGRQHDRDRHHRWRGAGPPPPRTDGAGVVVRDDGHVIALEHAVLAAFSDRAPAGARTPPALTGGAGGGSPTARGLPTAGGHVVIDLSAYAAAAQASAARLWPIAGHNHGGGRR